MKNQFLLPMVKLYGKLKPILHQKRNEKVYRALKELHPLENTDRLLEDFQIKKLAAMLVFFLIGIVSVICLNLCSRRESKLTEGAQLVRNEWGAGDYQVTLYAKSEDWDKEIPFLVEERLLTEEEQDELLQKLYRELPDLIKKENSDLSHIVGELDLISSVSGYPFGLTWNSSDSERISRTGKVNRKGVEEEEKIDLTVTLSYGQRKTTYTYEVILLPEILEAEENFFRSLENTLSEMAEEGKSRKQITLPDHLQDRSIKWQEVRKGNTILLLFLFVLGCTLVGRGMENELEKSCKKRREQLKMEYSGFVSKLRLYLSAGLTVRNAFFRIAADYEKTQKQKHKNFLCEEMKIACHQLENGVIEEQVYREFGKRCGETRYRKLSFLLAVHLKKGNDRLLEFLAEESDGAWEDRRNMARKAGEEAATKLLLPMMLMLAVVMFLILLPAYLDFGSI